MRILGLIPARGGSKGIPQKNLYPIMGKPLIVYAIGAARQSQLISNFIVSTDDNEIAECARKYGAEVPFMRPAELSQDDSSAFDVILHVLDWYADRQINWDLVVYLQPTSPLRTADSIDGAIKTFQSKQGDSLVSVIDVPHQFSIESQMIEEEGYLQPAAGDDLGRLRRQEKQSYVARNGPAILITKPDTIRQHQSLYGQRILSYKMNDKESFDIDTIEDVENIEKVLSQADN